MSTPEAKPLTGTPRAASLFRGPVLVVGARGMLGRAWTELLGTTPIAHVAPARRDLDLTCAAAVARVVDGSCPLVINCAAWTDVDGAESNEAAAAAANADGVRVLAEQCARVGAFLVHYSTDYIFNGRGERPYPTDHFGEPVNAYGRTKLAGERAIAASGCRALVLRTSWLYAPWGKNFVRTIAAAGRERPVLRVVNDQRGRPTSAQHLAACTKIMLERGAEGTFHVTDGGECSWFEFAREIVRLAGGSARVEPCTTADFPRPATRPAYSVLDLSRTEAITGPMPDWRINLRDALDRRAD